MSGPGAQGENGTVERTRRTAGQMLRFALVGGINTGVTLGLITLLYNVLGFPYLVANATGYGAGFVNSFVMNRSWTFRSRGDWRREGILFVGAFAASYVVQLGAYWAFHDGLGLRAEVAQLPAMVVYTGCNFILNKIVTFRSI